MKCSSCGGTMRYDVASYGLVCDFCGLTKRLHRPEEQVATGEFDFNAVVNSAPSDWGTARRLVTCNSCGAVMLYDSDQLSGMCPYCGSAIVLTEGYADCGIKPSAIIPFSITKEEVEAMFYKWNKFAFWSPEKFRKGKFLGNLTGVYIPYWTFDADAITAYSGSYGYTQDSGERTYTNWYKRSGIVESHINDYCVCASRRFCSDRLLNTVVEFKLSDLLPYTPDALAGFAAEKYTIGMDEAWYAARIGELRNRCEYETRKHESADTCRNVQMSTEYSNIKFRYILIPVWISACKYNGKVYNVVASGHNGKGNCNRPVSVLKLVLLILIILALFAAPGILVFIIQAIEVIAMGG